MCLNNFFLPLLGYYVVAGFFGRFLGGRGAAIVQQWHVGLMRAV